MDHPLAEYLRRPNLKDKEGRRMTQEEFAKKIGVSQAKVSKFLSGQIQGFDQDTAERVVEFTRGRVTLLDCLYATPYFQKRSSGPKSKAGSVHG